MNSEDESKSKIYMREWKRKDYARNGDKIKAKNKSYYYKYKFGFNSDYMKKYDLHLPLVAKIISNLNKLKEERPELVAEVLKEYLPVIENE